MPNHEIDTILSTLRLQADPELHPLFDQFETYYEQKLWHQLTKSLKLFFENDKSAQLRLRVYDTFVSKFYDKINELDVVEFLLLSLKSHSDHDEAVKYLNELKTSFVSIDERKQRNDGLGTHRDGCLLIDIEIARLTLLKGDLVKARDSLDSLEKTLETIDAVPLVLLNSFYSVNSLYYKLKNDFNNFYYTSLLYLSTIDKEHERQLSVQELKALAYDLSIAALAGDKIYNFGELLQHPIMGNIANDENKEYEWVFQLLNSLTVGDFDTFDSLVTRQIPKVPVLAANEAFLRQKICLMALVESVFSRNIRVLTFDDIARAAHLPRDNVEHLVMKSISLGLLKGSIDQVNEVVNITWVQPRIINFEQIKKMNDRLAGWDNQVKRLAENLEARGRSIWV